MTRSFVAALALSIGLTALPATVSKASPEAKATTDVAPAITLIPEEEGIRVEIDGQLFTRYLLKAGKKPVLWPILNASGKEMTRAYPFQEVEGETRDHIHQRSFWFTHGSVNGLNFWSEGDKTGSIVHREFVASEGTEQPTIISRNDWIGPDGTKICEDERTFRFSTEGTSRIIDVTLRVRASDGDVSFDDTKEGSFGIRVADSLRSQRGSHGKIVSSTGAENDATWGKPAAWVDYSGPIGDSTAGIAILNHPTSFRYPTHWHVRSYGLFAANPFGLKDFGQAESGTHVIPQGEEMTLRYRVIFHEGDHLAAGIAEAFEKYAAEKFE